MVTEHTIGGRILALRAQHHVSQLELAEALGISTAALRNLEKNNAEPRVSTLQALSRHFKVSIDFIVSGIEPAGANLDVFRDTGINDASIESLKQAYERGEYREGRGAYVAKLNALLTNGFTELIWDLNRLEDQLGPIYSELEKAISSETTLKNGKEMYEHECILSELLEKSDVLKLRFFREVERVFDNIMIDF